MTLRRVVTGTRDGKSVILSDGPAPTEHAFRAWPGLNSAIVWTTAPEPEVDVKESAPVGVSAHPDPGHALMFVVDFPPDSVLAGPDFDPAGVGPEMAEHLPGLAERFEPDNPGMHTTDTVDYGIVLEGPIWLELDDGRQTRLDTGDVVIQQRTRHAWRNLGTEAARLAFVLVGTGRMS
ncbi:cupin domain-containing protein [Nocardia cyriacigeorgica]|uniref:Cupin domain-containing protein n=1 Tax=Nocardia cyriacigeorgica TaxID=135487 RepID=A0A6P1CW13_9NOCA|nr:cupin domain-containing protein [Nocardia cyriacigeorgica]NEW36037.1 cupin domain-containing protein [Nocardia cyriacigeorgica]